MRGVLAGPPRGEWALLHCLGFRYQMWAVALVVLVHLGAVTALRLCPGASGMIQLRFLVGWPHQHHLLLLLLLMGVVLRVMQ